jgi:GTP-binding protein LepA
MATGAQYKVEEVGIFQLERVPKEGLGPGHVGYVIAGIKSVRDVDVGDTITLLDRPAEEPLPGFKKVKPMVFSSIYPISSEDFLDLQEALEKYRLNDSALVFQKESSVALGMGFRCGFLGLLHLEVVQERLEREFGQSIIMTLPSVRYRFQLTNGEEVEVDNPAYFPDPAKIKTAFEPYVRATVMMPDRYTGPVLELLREKRGLDTKFNYPSPGRVEIQVDLPLSEIIYDFYDRLKSVTQGYGSFDYDFLEYRPSDLVKVDILVNGEKVDALSFISHRQRARERALHVCEKLKEEIPRHLFKIPIQGAIGGQIIARTTINPYRKDVTAKCYGGDITRKRKLWAKQAAGKKRMKQVGQVEIPQRAFLAVLESND